MKTSYAFLDYGRWVVDCPECSDATAVYIGSDVPGAESGPVVRREQAACANGHVFAITMPPIGQEKKIMAAVADRDIPLQSWYPAQHARAAASGLKVGQSDTDLQAETDVLKAQAQDRKQRKDKLRQALIDAGYTVGPDGSFEGEL